MTVCLSLVKKMSSRGRVLARGVIRKREHSKYTVFRGLPARETIAARLESKTTPVLTNENDVKSVMVLR